MFSVRCREKGASGFGSRGKSPHPCQSELPCEKVRGTRAERRKNARTHGNQAIKGCNGGGRNPAGPTKLKGLKKDIPGDEGGKKGKSV